MMRNNKENFDMVVKCN